MLLAAYNADEPSGLTVLDYSGAGRHVTLANTLQRTTDAAHGAGALTAAALLAGGASGVPAAVMNTPGSRSVTFRGKRPATGAGVWMLRWEVIAADSGAFGVYVLDNTLRGRARKGGVPTNIDAPAPTDGAFHDFALTYDASTGALRLYQDGVLVASGTVPGGGQLDAADGVDVAADGTNPGTGTNATRVDDPRIYDHALTPAEIAADRATPVGAGPTDHPVEGTVAVVSDTAGAVTARRAVEGTAAALSGTSGTATARRQAAGEIAAHSGASGAAAAGRAVAGRVDATSTITGAAAAHHQVAGTVTAASGVSGAVTASGQEDDDAELILGPGPYGSRFAVLAPTGSPFTVSTPRR